MPFGERLSPPERRRRKDQVEECEAAGDSLVGGRATMNMLRIRTVFPRYFDGSALHSWRTECSPVRCGSCLPTTEPSSLLLLCARRCARLRVHKTVWRASRLRRRTTARRGACGTEKRVLCLLCVNHSSISLKRSADRRQCSRAGRSARPLGRIHLHCKCTRRSSFKIRARLTFSLAPRPFGSSRSAQLFSA